VKRRRPDVAELLDQARAAATDAAVLDTLLDAYRSRPLPALGELIAIAGKRAAADHPVTGSLNDQQARWLERARAARATDLEWLLDHLITGRAEYSLERVLELHAWPLDPRLSAGLLALAASKKMTARGSRGFWREAFRIIAKQLHPGLAPILKPLLELTPQTEFEHGLLKKLRTVEAKLDRLVPPAPSAAEREALAGLTQRLDVARHQAAQKTADDFLREIWAAPDDDGPREVFADWLQERGDPRGELIALQLARHRNRLARLAGAPGGDELPSAREKALLAKHRRAWAAPFEPVLSMPNTTFDRGFLYAVHVHWRKLASLPALMTHPGWATVRRFQLDPEGERLCDPWIDHMLALGAKRG